MAVCTHTQIPREIKGLSLAIQNIECGELTGRMKQSLIVDAFIQRIKSKKLTDKRVGQNVQYKVNDAIQVTLAIFLCEAHHF